MAEFVAMVLKTAIKSVIFLFILFLFMEMGLLAFGAMITHSHCPNHSRNNTENMHTHDTSDPDHNAKHKAGHPHTWEFDEHCPPGTERDTSKKSRGYVQNFPSKPVQFDDGDTGFMETGDQVVVRGGGGGSPIATTPESTEPGCFPSGYSIEVNDKDQVRLVGEAKLAYLFLFFDDSESSFYTIMIGWQHPKSLSLDDFNKWQDMAGLEIVDYRSPMTNCIICKNMSVADAKRMVLRVLEASRLCYVAEYPEAAPSAPSIGKRKLATAWASLKMR